MVSFSKLLRSADYVAEGVKISVAVKTSKVDKVQCQPFWFGRICVCTIVLYIFLKNHFYPFWSIGRKQLGHFGGYMIN